jgi:uncharacterized peroxidase-related enzyme
MSRLKSVQKSEASPKSQQMMGELESKGMLLNIFRAMANSSAVLDSFLKFSGALGQGKLDAKTRHAIALAVGQVNKCEYCLAAHAALGKQAGLDDAGVRDARLGKSADRKINGALVLAKELVAKQGHVSDADLSKARTAGLDDGDIAEVVANVGINLFTNYFNHLNQTKVDLPRVPVEIG